MNQLKYTHAHHARCRAEASRLGLGYGDAHPDTGMLFSGASFLKPHTFERLRRADLIRGARTRAKARGLPFALSLEWLNAAWPVDGCCPVIRHIRLTWGSGNSKRACPSIDRIHPELGYVPSNCRIISNRANTLKNNASVEEMEAILADLKEHDSAH